MFEAPAEDKPDQASSKKQKTGDAETSKSDKKSSDLDALKNKFLKNKKKSSKS